jgi:hypothetical protein
MHSFLRPSDPKIRPLDSAKTHNNNGHASQIVPRDDRRPSVVGFLAQHPVHRRPTDLERLGDVDRPHALRLDGVCYWGKTCRVESVGTSLNLTRSRHRRSHCFALRDFLFDHLVGAQQDRLRHYKAERFGGLDVDSHLKFYRQLNR